MGQQDIWMGAPILPEDLSELHYGARKAAVIEAINSLGPDASVETPLAGDPAFAEDVETWATQHGVSSEHATLLRVLHERPHPSTPVAALLAAAAEGAGLSLTDSPEDIWMRTLARWTLGSD